MADKTSHTISVSKRYWQGGYAVHCSHKNCGKIGRGVDPDKNKARQKAWNLGHAHAARKSGGGVLGA